MMPLEENLDTFPRAVTPNGRSLVNAGGIFPDLEVQDDTLTLLERDLLRVVGEEQFPIGLREAEFSFEVAGELRDAGADVSLTQARFDGFIESLIAAGLPAESVADPSVRTYLNWRARLTIAQRMEDIGAEADIRMERDPVLTEAVRLLSLGATQEDLFAAVESATASTNEVGSH